MVGYYSTTKDNALSVSFLQEQLSTFLPSYMVPEYFVQLAELPMTANGKVDKVKLPLPEMNSSVTEKVKWSSFIGE